MKREILREIETFRNADELMSDKIKLSNKI
jgi:hypothetical protein